MTDADYLALLANSPVQAESLLHNQEQPAGSISGYAKANKTEFIFLSSSHLRLRLQKRPTAPLQRGKTLPLKSVLVMTLNNLIVILQ